MEVLLVAKLNHKLVVVGLIFEQAAVNFFHQDFTLLLIVLQNQRYKIWKVFHKIIHHFQGNQIKVVWNNLKDGIRC